jgi:hypothetical protein
MLIALHDKPWQVSSGEQYVVLQIKGICEFKREIKTHAKIPRVTTVLHCAAVTN